MQQSFIVFNFLLPPHQQPAELIHPRLPPLNYPSPRRVLLFSINRLVCLPTLLQMQVLIPGQYSCYYIFLVVTFIQTEVVNSIDLLFGSLNYYAIERLHSHHLKSSGICQIVSTEDLVDIAFLQY
jgi:hypothetical protein